MNDFCCLTILPIMLDKKHNCQCIIIEMSKKSENNISTERILKSKYLDKDKQNTIPLIKHKPSTKKIKLTDLCPEQKLKIGELIKVLDQRRKDNEELAFEVGELTREVDQLKADLQSSRLQCLNAKKKYQEKQQKIAQINEQVHLLKDKLRLQNQKNSELSRTSQEYLIKLQQIQKEKRNMQIQTEIKLINQFTQTTFTHKETGIQTQKQEHERDLFYRPHSKSFEKIMKAPFSVQLPKGSVHNSHSIQTSKGKYSSHSNGRQTLTDKRSHQDEEFDELNHKWNQLKAKNQQSKVEWEESPHSFHATEVQKESSKKKKSKMNQIDEIALNKMLRLKDFSASKLMRLGKQLTSQKKEKQSPQVNYLKSPYFNRIEPDSQVNTKTLKPLKKSHVNSENQINFYESGLFDVDSNRE